jgi:hypothetical protein
MILHAKSRQPTEFFLLNQQLANNGLDTPGMVPNRAAETRLSRSKKVI